MENVSPNMSISVDIDAIEDFVTNKKFSTFLVENSTDIIIPLFILQVLTDKIKEIRVDECE